MRRVWAACAVAVVLVVSTGPTPGAQTRPDLGASPALGLVSTDAGRMVQDSVVVVNLSDEEMNVTASLAPLEIDADGSFRAPTSSDLPSAVEWGTVEPSTFSLPRGNSRQVTAVITPPAGTPAGGYYAAIKLQGSNPSGTSLAVHPVLLEVAGDGILTRRGRLVDVEIPSAGLRTSIPVTMTLRNTGNVHVVAQGRVTVLDALSRVTATVPITRTPVLPGRNRIVVVEVPAPLVPWKVTVRANVAFGRGSSEVAVSATGYSLPWWGIVAALIVAILITRLVLAIVHRRRRRRVEAPEAALPTEIAVDQAALEEAAEPASVAADAEAWADAWELEPVPRTQQPEAEEEPEEVPADAFAPPRDEPELVPELEQEEAATEEPEPVASGGVLDLSEVFAREPEPEPGTVLEPEPEIVPETVPEPVPVSPSVFKELEGVGEPEPEPGPEPEPEPRAPARAFPPGAAVRRARVAVGLLTAGARVAEEKLDVALEILEAVRDHEAVRDAVVAAFEDARGARRGDGGGALALALDAVDSDRAPAALLEAYASAKEPTDERIRAAIRRYGPDRLRAHQDLISALPKKRREELGLG